MTDVIFLEPHPTGDDARIVLCCLPGGGFCRRYWDLPAVAGEGEFSMAAHLADRGAVMVLIDHLGIGDSTVPDDPYVLTPTLLADVNDVVVRTVLRQLADGAVPGFPSGRPLVPIGVGHSMGGHLTAIQQARRRTHTAIALLGTGCEGVPRLLSAEELDYTDDQDRLRADLPELTRRRWGTALPAMAQANADALVAPSTAPAVRAALQTAMAPILGLAALSAMVPGSCRDELRRIDVPLLLGFGDADLMEDPYVVPPGLTASADVTRFVLSDSYHNHNVAPGRAVLWDRLWRWAVSVSPAVATPVAPFLSPL